jgi:hypothetical protein
MALLIAITNNKGVTANYHRIVAVRQVYEGNNPGIYVELVGYTNKAYRDAEVADQAAGLLPFNTSLAINNTTVFLPFVEGEGFKLGALYTRLKVEMVDFLASTDI